MAASLAEEELERKKKKKEEKKKEKAKKKGDKKAKAVGKAETTAKWREALKDQNPEKRSRLIKRYGVEKDANALDDDVIDPAAPLGEKKRLSPQMAKRYSPALVEKSLYEWWESSGFFNPDSTSPNSKPPFCVELPPPNVTGALHIGHALTAVIQDTIIRWRRISGYNAVWVPHAGIATQVVVEKKIMRDFGKIRHDLGRDELVKRVWLWKEEYGGKILKQERRLGASLDWSRECFTMDEQRSKA